MLHGKGLTEMFPADHVPLHWGGDTTEKIGFAVGPNLGSSQSWASHHPFLLALLLWIAGTLGGMIGQ